MGITDNQGYVKRTMAGFLGLLMAQSAASAKSKFLSLPHLDHALGLSPKYLERVGAKAEYRTYWFLVVEDIAHSSRTRQ